MSFESSDSNSSAELSSASKLKPSSKGDRRGGGGVVGGGGGLRGRVARAVGFVRREHAWLRKTVRVTRRLSVHLLESQIPRMSAALAYRTLFSLIPVVVLGLVVLGSFASDEDIEKLLQDVLSYAGLTEIVVAPSPPERAEAGAFDSGWGDGGWGDWWAGTGVSGGSTYSAKSSQGGAGSLSVSPAPHLGDGAVGASSESGDGAMSGAAANDVAGTGGVGVGAGEGGEFERLDQWIAAIVRTVRDTPLAAIGVVGLVFLFYAAIAMLVEVERSFNSIYRTKSGRSWIKRVPAYWMTLTLGSTFLVLTFYVSERLRGSLRNIIEWAELGAVGSGLISAIGPLFSVSLSILILVTFYVTLPNTRVRLRSAMAGAVIAAVLWEVAKFGFTEYVKYSATYARIYGSIALVPLFMLWVYVTWMIVLFGLSISAAMQLNLVGEDEDDGEEGSGARVRPMSSLAMTSIAGALARGFAKGESVSLVGLSSASGLSLVDARRLVDRLRRAGVAHEVVPPEGGVDGDEGGGGGRGGSRRRDGRRGGGRVGGGVNGNGQEDFDEDEVRFSLSRPPGSIRLAELADLAELPRGGGGDCGVNGACGSFAAIRRDLLGSKTLADVLDPGDGRENGEAGSAGDASG